MWQTVEVNVGGEDVVLHVHRLDEAETHRTASSLAWLTLDTLTGGDAWRWDDAVGELIHQHVSVTMDEARVSQMDGAWWSVLFRTALLEFMRANGLASLVNQQMVILRSSTDRARHTVA